MSTKEIAGVFPFLVDRPRQMKRPDDPSAEKGTFWLKFSMHAPRNPAWAAERACIKNPQRLLSGSGVIMGRVPTQREHSRSLRYNLVQIGPKLAKIGAVCEDLPVGEGCFMSVPMSPLVRA